MALIASLMEETQKNKDNADLSDCHGGEEKKKFRDVFGESRPNVSQSYSLEIR